MYLTEVGQHGWSAACQTLAEANRVLCDRRRELTKMKTPATQWAIWQDGEFVLGVWPGYRSPEHYSR